MFAWSCRENCAVQLRKWWSSQFDKVLICTNPVSMLGLLVGDPCVSEWEAVLALGCSGVSAGSLFGCRLSLVLHWLLPGVGVGGACSLAVLVSTHVGQKALPVEKGWVGTGLMGTGGQRGCWGQGRHTVIRVRLEQAPGQCSDTLPLFSASDQGV